jgi:hypothetical protein
LRRLALAQLGSAEVLDEPEFMRRVAAMTIRTIVPRALRIASEIHPEEKHKTAMREAAERCERDGDKAAAINAADAARWAARWAAAGNVAAAVAAGNVTAAVNAAANATCLAARLAADTTTAANATRLAADTTTAANATRLAARLAATAANATRLAADTAGDCELAVFTEAIVQILIKMGAPGCQWLDLAPTPAKF